MSEVYFRKGKKATSTFSLFIRDYPPNRGYFIAAGLQDALDYILNLNFSSEILEYLKSTGDYSKEFLDYLSIFKFTGNVHALPEGTIFFVNEPILEVTAPILEAQMLESYLVNIINFSVMIATKASRCYQVAKDKSLVDFSLRRTHGAEASLRVARSSYIGGMSGTSNVLAGYRYGIPTFGTMAHSFVTAFDREIESFKAFAEVYPKTTTLLIDTYDSVAGIDDAIQVGLEMKVRSENLYGIRLDSGNILKLSKYARKKLDEAGLTETKIIVSGGMNEYKIQDLLVNGAPIDGFGIGTKMGVSADQPYQDTVYKLIDYDGRPISKLSIGKSLIPGRKQVFRYYENNRIKKDIIANRDEIIDGEPLLQPFITNGYLNQEPESLDDIKKRALANLDLIPPQIRRIEDPDYLPVEQSPGLIETQSNTLRYIAQHEWLAQGFKEKRS